MSKKEFKKLKHLPDPMIGEDNHYISFQKGDYRRRLAISEKTTTTKIFAFYTKCTACYNARSATSGDCYII